MENAVHYLAPDAPWKVEASERVWAGLNRQSDPQRHVLHLINWETDLPATGVRLSVNGGSIGEIKATQVWPERSSLACTTEDGWTTFTIPEVGPHVMIVLE